MCAKINLFAQVGLYESKQQKLVLDKDAASTDGIKVIVSFLKKWKVDVDLFNMLIIFHVISLSVTTSYLQVLKNQQTLTTCQGVFVSVRDFM